MFSHAIQIYVVFPFVGIDKFQNAKYGKVIIAAISVTVISSCVSCKQLYVQVYRSFARQRGSINFLSLI